jgi:hypothetical protein
LAVLRHIALTRLDSDRQIKLGIENEPLVEADGNARNLAELLFVRLHAAIGTRS